jgi:ribosomal protein S18 acetylase RimI-like enzyme
MIIKPAHDLDVIRTLFREYAQTLPITLDFQGFDDELNSLPGKYREPDGRLYVAEEEGEVVGCVALRRFDATRGELKRLYVRPAYRHRGIAQALTLKIIQEAKSIGYDELVLDTLRSMTTAIRFYTAMGFHETPAYYPNPHATAYFAMTLKTPTD